MIKKHERMWRWWAKALGEKPSKCDRESDIIALIRTFIFVSYLTTNLFIIANTIRHWNDNHQVSSSLHSPKEEKNNKTSRRRFYSD
jgi:hypothetical protein